MRTFFEAAPEDDVAANHRELVRFMEDEPFVAELAEEFGFPDRTALAEVLVDVEGLQYFSPAEEWDDRRGDTLDELDGPLGVVIALLEDKLNQFRVWGHFPDTDLIEKLKDILATARKEHRGRDSGQPTGPLAPLEKLELRTLVGKLAAFWVTATGTRFEFDHVGWSDNEGPKNRRGGSFFVFRVVEHFAPGRLHELKGVLRAAKVENNPPKPGKPRGRPPTYKVRR